MRRADIVRAHHDMNQNASYGVDKIIIKLFRDGSLIRFHCFKNKIESVILFVITRKIRFLPVLSKSYGKTCHATHFVDFNFHCSENVTSHLLRLAHYLTYFSSFSWQIELQKSTHQHTNALPNFKPTTNSKMRHDNVNDSPTLSINLKFRL